MITRVLLQFTTLRLVLEKYLSDIHVISEMPDGSCWSLMEVIQQSPVIVANFSCGKKKFNVFITL